MFDVIAKKFFGSANDRFIKSLHSRVDQINALEPEFENLSDDDLRAKTEQFREQLSGGASLDDILDAAFATVREAAKRTLKQRHFDVQLLGGLVLHQGKIAEMKTGEGKTLVATLAVYLNAIEGKGVHVITVNDYLAQRDADWMGQVYQFLGLSVGCIVHGLDDVQRKQQYACDVTYGTNNEFGFDYLRDNMKFRMEDMAQRDFNFAIVDEVDSILIDEARTPLIISGPTEDNSELYTQIDKVIPHLVAEDFEKDEKSRAVTFTDEGSEHIENLLNEAGILQEGGLYDLANINLIHHANQSLRAHQLFVRDKDYIVSNDMVVIIDEFTGRMMEGRRYSDGLHQALEAKERVSIQNENQTLASITFQNYFRLYPKLAGMTGTAMTEAGEFSEIYNLEVIEMPTNVDIIRKDLDDEVYRTEEEKFEAIVLQIRECQERKQPVLVGTVSIEKSEQISTLLKKYKITHSVLNARNHENEAAIIAQAGSPGTVTIATNMAGRGTDIQMGGNLDMQVKQELATLKDESKHAAAVQKISDEIETKKPVSLKAGGLFVLCTERHESRRIDNQLRGRSGRQGDPGGSKFYLSLEDDLMRIFGSERIDSMLKKLGLEQGEAIVHPWVNKALEKAQQKVEARNFEIRKNLLKFDDVMNEQRKVIYDQRRELMSTDNIQDTIVEMRHEVLEDIVSKCIPEKAYIDQWDITLMHEECRRLLGLDLPVQEWAKEEGIAEIEIRDRIIDASDRKMAEKAVRFSPEIMRNVEKSLLLQVLDQMWKEHLLTLDHLRQGIGLRAYGQRDPLREYQREAFDLFEEMLGNLRQRITTLLSNIEIEVAPTESALRPSEQIMHEGRVDPASQAPGSAPETDAAHTPVQSRQQSGVSNPDDPTSWGRVARNAVCPCGSGNKYKHCHGKLT